MKTTTLADRIKTRRAQLGLSVDDLAEVVGVSGTAVRKWESGGSSNLKLEHLFAVSEALNVAPRWLALGEGSMEAGSPREAYSAILGRRERARTERERKAWERISLVFAKAASVLLLVVPALLAPKPAIAAVLHSAYWPAGTCAKSLTEYTLRAVGVFLTFIRKCASGRSSCEMLSYSGG